MNRLNGCLFADFLISRSTKDPCVHCETTHPQLRAVLGPKMTGWMVSSLLVLFLCFSATHADPTISTSTPTPCYGDVVTLVCHHPEVASNPERYFSQPTAWEENGVGITPIPGTMFTDEIAKDRKSSTLNINITVDHFKNKSFNYSCLLVLAKNGLPSSEVERSENVTIDPVDSPKRPHNVTLAPDVTSINVSWEHDKSCFEDRTFEFKVTWQKVDAANRLWRQVNGTTYNIKDLEPGTNYSICIFAVSTSDRRVKSEQQCQYIYLKEDKNTTANPYEPTSTAVAAGVPPNFVINLLVVTTVVVGILLAAHTVDVVGLLGDSAVVAVVLLVALVCLVSIWRLYRRIQDENRRKRPTPPVLEVWKGYSELVLEQGCCRARAIKDQPWTASQRTITDYPELDFNADIEGEDLPTSKLNASLLFDGDEGGSSGVAENDSESEDLPTSKQETSPSPSSIIQPGTGPAQVNNNTIMEVGDMKRWTVPDEPCVESREETPPCDNDCSTSTFQAPEDEELTTIVKTESYALDDQNVRGILSGVPNDDSESEDLPTPEQVVDTSPMVLPKCLSPPNTSPSPDYQGGCSGVTSDDRKTHDDPFRSPHKDTIISGQYSVPVSPITNGLFLSFFEYKPSDEEEVLHKRVLQGEVMETEAMPLPVQETPLTTCSPPSTAASIANFEYPEEPLPTTASVASGECLEPIPVAVTNSSHECPDLPRTDDSNIPPQQTSVNSIISEHMHVDLPPVNQKSTQFSGKTYGFLGGPETSQDPSQYQQNWGLWTRKKTESFQYMSTVNDGSTISVESCGLHIVLYVLVHWVAHLFQTALHHSVAFFVLQQESIKITFLTLSFIRYICNTIAYISTHYYLAIATLH